MIRQAIVLSLVVGLGVATGGCSRPIREQSPAPADVRELLTAEVQQRVSVHDPSLVVTPEDLRYRSETSLATPLVVLHTGIYKSPSTSHGYTMVIAAEFMDSVHVLRTEGDFIPLLRNIAVEDELVAIAICSDVIRTVGPGRHPFATPRVFSTPDALHIPAVPAVLGADDPDAVRGLTLPVVELSGGLSRVHLWAIERRRSNYYRCELVTSPGGVASISLTILDSTDRIMLFSITL